MRDTTIDVQNPSWTRPRETGPPQAETYGWTTRWSWRLFAVSLPLSIAAAHIALGLLILAAALRLRAGEIRWRKTPLEKVLAFYLIVCAVTAVVGLVPSKAAVQLVSFWHISIYWLMVNTIFDDVEIRELIYLILIGSVISSLVGIVQQGLTITDRAMGFFDHPMTFGGQTEMILVLAVAVWLQLPGGRERWVRRVMAIALLILFGGLLASYTRSAWIGFLTGVTGVGLARGLKTWLALMGLGILFVAGVAAFHPSLGQRIQSIPDTSQTVSNVDRLKIWGATIEMIKDHPIFGVGGGGYRTALEAYRERWGLPTRPHAHNNFLQQTAEHGLFGLIAFTTIWIVILKSAWLAWRSGLPAPYRGWLVGGAMAVAAFLTAGLFEANFGDSEVAMAMWLMVGLVMWVRMRVLPQPTERTGKI